QSRLTRIVDQMAARGLVTRRADPRDGRRVRVHLTEAGRALAARLTADARAHEARLLARLTEDDAARIKPMLQGMLAGLSGEAE
ncbi:MAG: MarR family transcriptional regulator, partial [Pseudomonadota bacterium]